MKVLDVQLFREGLQRNIRMLTRLENEMKVIEKAVEGIVAMEASLKGKGGQAIRAFYKECHLPFLQFFITFKFSFSDILSRMDAALDSLEPNSSGLIRQEFLEGELEQGLNCIGQLTRSLTNEANTIMNQVADIIALPHLDDSEVQMDIYNARLKRNETINQLYEFDRSQVNALTTIADDLDMMETWITDIESMITDGLTDINFPADVWNEYSLMSPLKKKLETQLNQMDDITEGSTDENPGQVTSSKEEVKPVGESILNTEKMNTFIVGAVSSFRMYMAGKNDGLKVTKVYNPQTGKYSYRLNASKSALKSLGIEPDAKILKELMRGLPKDQSKWKPQHYTLSMNNKVMLKYATKKSGQSGWSVVGEQALKKHPSLAYWNDQSTLSQKAKTVGKATLTGTSQAFKDIVDVKEIMQNGALKGASKALAPAAAGLNYYNNYQAAKHEGLDNEKAATRATVDTVVDTAVGAAVQTGSVALFTALVPIPGVGTAIGVTAGLAANAALNIKFGKNDKSMMDRIKGCFS